ncbi:MAG: copper homeostasis protein CutC [Bacteroidales bacterium]|nr:copper homeostasis protein CutC [Bacteroidales bacterium]
MALLEICCGTLDSAITALCAGAHRLELCSALDEGGLTPSHGLLRAVGRLEGIQKHVLIRPRGGDFLYTAAELEVMVNDIAIAKDEGFDGIVVGALCADGSIDIEACRTLIQAAAGMSVTFHRAFDLCAHRAEALEQIVELGCQRILTSGGAPTAWEGRAVLAQLVEQAAGRIVIMPAAGVKASNAAEILLLTGAQEIHASARAPLASLMDFVQDGVAMGNPQRDEYVRYETSFDEVAQILACLSSLKS